ncbi:MAG TPA: glutathione synthase [Burkholderiales bacterium]|nr:glutathione synthase [Burkholderiales bacterium]
MGLLFITDPPEELKAYKDTTVAMMRAAQARGQQAWICAQTALHWTKNRVAASATRISLTDDDEDWYRTHESATRALPDYDAVLMRKDPPFDMEYVASTWLLEEAERKGARVFNSPRAIRDHNEKFAIAEFPQFTVPSLVARSMEHLQAFADEHKKVVFKRLDGMGGAGIFVVRHDDPNRNVIVETVSDGGTRSVMAQRFIPEIAQGDKRVILIDGEVVPHCLARIPKPGESRGNLAAGARGEAQAVTPRHREIAAAIGPALAARGLLFVGLDVIGDWLTELNVTSPTGFREIRDQTGFDVAGTFVEALLSKLS